MKSYYLIIIGIFTYGLVIGQSSTFEIEGNVKIDSTILSLGNIEISSHYSEPTDAISKVYADSVIIDFAIALGSSAVQVLLDIGYSPLDLLSGYHIDTSDFIGLSYKGGAIIYLKSDGTGIVAAKADLADAEWGYYEVPVDSPSNAGHGATGTGIGSGITNTQDILSGDMNSGIAAKLCDDYMVEGYDDWYLPSRLELVLMSQLRTTEFALDYDYYWSSTTPFQSGSSPQNSTVVRQSVYLTRARNEINKVRPVRNF